MRFHYCLSKVALVGLKAPSKSTHNEIFKKKPNQKKNKIKLKWKKKKVLIMLPAWTEVSVKWLESTGYKSQAQLTLKIKQME